MKRVHIIGAGLIGGSIALALSKTGWLVTLEDESPKLTEEALTALSISQASTNSLEVDVVFVAVPISANRAMIERSLKEYPNAIVIDIASVKTNSLPEIESAITTLERFVSTHPLAGKELHGAQNAAVDLFESRVWAICTGPYLSERAKITAENVIRDCGAIPFAPNFVIATELTTQGFTRFCIAHEREWIERHDEIGNVICRNLGRYCSQ